MSSPRLRAFQLAAYTVLAVTGIACRRDDGAEDVSAHEGVTAAQPGAALVFPDELQVDDASVNAFLLRAMKTCADGEYEAFRLLWSARDEPLPRANFEEGWQAVEEIRICAIERVMLNGYSRVSGNPPTLAYAVYADVNLDPTHKAAQRDPQRQVVLMMIWEHNEWRFARAPKSIRQWIIGSAPQVRRVD